MSSVRLNIPRGFTTKNGKQVSFRAPCSCDSLETLVIGDEIYQLLDTTKNPVSSARGQVFASGSIISVLLDKTYMKAYVQSPSPITIELVRW